MDYEEMSDFEINKAVAFAIGHKVSDARYYVQREDDRICQPECYILDGHETSWFNPCNNPSDAWPIIEREDVWEILMDSSCSDMAFWYLSERKLRDSMIVFLKMQ